MYVWLVECHITGKFWSTVGTVCESRRAARVEDKWYRLKFPDGRYRIRKYVRDGGSRG